MHIRLMDYPADAAHILMFLPELYESNFRGFTADAEFIGRKRAQLKEAYRDPGQAVLVAVDEAGICGFIWLTLEIEYAGRRRGEVSALHVAVRARGRGVGKELMADAEAYFRRYGCTYVHLMVTASNEVAVGLYQSLGYGVTRLQMEKEL